MNRSYRVALSTDLYQFTMGASYASLSMRGTAIFSLFARRLPANRSFLVVAGIEEALDRVQQFRFDDAALAYLQSTNQIPDEFLKTLAKFRFSGDIRAIPEGQFVFANEPIIEVEAPILEAQLIETIIINAVHYPTLVATKAARCIYAAGDTPLIDFGLRRTPGIEAGLAAARACYLAGFSATSNMLAGKRYDIPVSGTLAHSFIETFDSEFDAFLAFGQSYPGPVTLLIDTYDTLEGAQKAVGVARELARQGKTVQAVRLDSGDLLTLSQQVRRILDDAGFTDIQIIASGGLDEFSVAKLQASNARIDAYGIGTRVGTSADAPSCDMAYKLVEYDGRPTFKLSSGKRSLVGPKQVWRKVDRFGVFQEDCIAALDEHAPGSNWEPVLRQVMKSGELLHRPSLVNVRRYHRQERDRLPEYLFDFDSAPAYPVHISKVLQERQHLAEAQGPNS